MARSLNLQPRQVVDRTSVHVGGSHPTIEGSLARISQCAVRRHHSPAGANPARQLSLQPVAVGADDGGNDISRSTSMTKGRHGRPSDHAGRNASERRAGLETGDVEADPPEIRGRLPAVGKRATRAPAGSAGVVAAARMEEGNGRNTGSPAGGVARANRQPARVRSGRTGWRRGP